MEDQNEGPFQTTDGSGRVASPVRGISALSHEAREAKVYLHGTVLPCVNYDSLRCAASQNKRQNEFMLCINDLNILVLIMY